MSKLLNNSNNDGDDDDDKLSKFFIIYALSSFRELLLQTEKLGIWNMLIIGSVKGKRV